MTHTPRSTRRAHWSTAGALLLAATTLAACGSGGGDPCGGILAPTRVLTASPSTLTLDVGTQGQLTAQASTDCSADDQSVRWASVDPAIATVDATGRVRAVRVGTTSITVTAFGNSAQRTLTVNVQPRTPTTLDARPDGDTLSLPVATRTLAATVRDQLGDTLDTQVSWSTLTPGVAGVSTTGVVTAVGSGTAFIVASTARAAGDSLRDTVRVIVIPAFVAPTPPAPTPPAPTPPAPTPPPPPAEDCTVRAYTVGTTATGSIGATTCRSVSGYSLADQYRITTAAAQFFSLRLAASVRSTFVPLVIGGTSYALPASDTAVTALLAVRAGTYGFLVTFASASSGSYSVSSLANPDARASCVPTLATLGVSFATGFSGSCRERDITILPALAASAHLRVSVATPDRPITVELRDAATGAVLQTQTANPAKKIAVIDYTNGATARRVIIRIGTGGSSNMVVPIVIDP